MEPHDNNLRGKKPTPEPKVTEEKDVDGKSLGVKRDSCKASV